MPVPARFNEYIKYGTDRCRFIQSYLAENGVETVLIPVEGKKHIYVKFPLSSYSPRFRIKTLIVHYDIVENSPGANDNSAADFSVMEFAIRLMKFRGVHNVRIFFTDGEELGEGGVEGQGAYALAQLLKKSGIRNDDVFVFDCMGRGTVPVLAKSIAPSGAPAAFARQLENLKLRAEELLRSSCNGHWLTLPVPYSDNAGFLACGIPAVAITMLPESEAFAYMKALQQMPELEKLVMNRKTENELVLRTKLPPTWKFLHTENDSIMSLTPESFDFTARIFDELARLKTI